MATELTIAGNTFLFTGKLTEFTREEAEAHVEAEGGKVLSGVSAKLNYLVVGEDGGSKLAKAEALGTVTILHEKEFLKMMQGGKKAPTKKASKEETNFVFARHSSTNISKYNGLEITIGALEKNDLIAISSLIEDEEYFDSKYFTEFYSFDSLFHSQGVLVDSSDKKLKKLRDDNSLSSNNVFINEVVFETFSVPKAGNFLCSFRNEDVYLIAKGTAISIENKIPVDCRISRFEFVSPSINLLNEVHVNGDIIDRDSSGAEDINGKIYNAFQVLLIDGKPFEIDQDYKNKKTILKSLSNYATASKTKDPEVSKIIAKLDGGSITSIDQIKEKYRSNIEVLTKALEIDGSNLSQLSDEQKDNKDLVKIAIKSSAMAFEYASDALKNNKIFIAEVLNLNGSILEFVSDEIKNNKELAIISVSNKASAIQFLNKKLKSDPEIIQNAINKGLVNDATVLEFLPSKYQDSKDIVMKILALNGFDFEYASERLKNDLDCVKAACKHDSYALSYCNDKIKSDLNFFFELLEFTKDTSILEYFSDKIKDNESALLACAKYDGLHYSTGEAGGIIKHASNRLKNSKEFILKFIQIAPYVLDYIPKDLAKDKDVKLLAKKY